MAGDGRVNKTLDRHLLDLECHLQMAEEDLIRTVCGETHRLKSLTAELRVLVCESSGTEGLLWRVADAMGIADAVALARSTIKTRMVGNSAGKLYTFDTLIRRASQQLGSAHESDRVEPDLISLERTHVGHVSALAHYLIEAAKLSLRAGDDVIGKAEVLQSFQRTWHASIGNWEPLDASNLTSTPAPMSHFAEEPVGPPAQGTISFWLRHPHEDWQTNAHGYDFGTMGDSDLSVSVRKEPDRTISIVIIGVRPDAVTFQGLLGEPEGPRVMIAVSWDAQIITIYINGKPVKTYS